MDSPLPLEDPLQPTEATDPARHAAAYTPDGRSQPISKRRKKVAPPAPSWRRRPATVVPLIALGTAALVLLGYGAARQAGDDHTSVTSRLPDASSVGAAVNNLPPPDLLKPVTPEQALKQNAERPFADRPDTPAR